MKIAIVHDWSVGYAGSERVLEQLLVLFPDASLFLVADFIPPAEREFLGGRTPATTFIQRLPGARRHVQRYLPLMPLAVESLDLSGFDVILSSSHAVAKGVLTGPDQVHICYCHTPLRYAWDLQHQYLRASGLTGGIRRAAALAVLHYMRLWDSRTAAGVDCFVANSQFVARRIRRVYGREAEVLHPPVDTSFFSLCEEKDDYYFSASRLAPYKRVELLLESFRRMPGRRLIVAGGGPLFERLKLQAPPNVKLLGHVDPRTLRGLMQRARAFVFAAEEDFGIVLGEALACGTPAICYGRGGALDIVEDGSNGVHFRRQDPDDLCAAVARFESIESRFDRRRIHRDAARFSIGAFRDGFRSIFERCLAWRGAEAEAVR